MELIEMGLVGRSGIGARNRYPRPGSLRRSEGVETTPHMTLPLLSPMTGPRPRRSGVSGGVAFNPHGCHGGRWGTGILGLAYILG